MIRSIVNVVAPLALIGVGVTLYEDWYWSAMQMHVVVYFAGCNLALAGVLWLASDWFRL
jgi:hypothetical protein